MIPAPLEAFLGIDHVQIMAPPGCEVAARRFFGEVLGLVEAPKPAPIATRGGVWFQVGSQQLHVGVETDFHPPPPRAHPALRLVDEAALNVLRKRIESAGLQVRGNDELPETARFFLDDPWGNRLEFVASRGSSPRGDEAPVPGVG